MSVRVGRVVDAGGTPVRDALVSIARGTAPTPEIGYRTGADGALSIDLPDGDFEVDVRTPDGCTARIRLDIRTPGKWFTIRLPV